MTVSRPSHRPAPDLAGQRCLVLGGGGFLGRNLCERLHELGADVSSFGRTPGATGTSWSQGQVRHFSGSFDDCLALSNALEGQNFVFHLISGTVPESSNQDPVADLLGVPPSTVRFLDICRKVKITKVIFASSGGAVYGIPSDVPIREDAATNPISAYGISKLTIEKYFYLYHHLHGLAYQALRIANPYGRFQLGHKRQGLIGTLIHRALSGQILEIWGDGTVIRDFVHVDDVTDAFVVSMLYDGAHRVLNVGSGCGLSVNDILDELDIAIGTGPLPRLYTPSRAVDVPINILDSSLLRREMGWSPLVDWKSGIRSTIAWMASEYSMP